MVQIQFSNNITLVYTESQKGFGRFVFNGEESIKLKWVDITYFRYFIKEQSCPDNFDIEQMVQVLFLFEGEIEQAIATWPPVVQYFKESQIEIAMEMFMDELMLYSESNKVLEYLKKQNTIRARDINQFYRNQLPHNKLIFDQIYDYKTLDTLIEKVKTYDKHWIGNNQSHCYQRNATIYKHKCLTFNKTLFDEHQHILASLFSKNKKVPLNTLEAAFGQVWAWFIPEYKNVGMSLRRGRDEYSLAPHVTNTSNQCIIQNNGVEITPEIEELIKRIQDNKIKHLKDLQTIGFDKHQRALFEKKGGDIVLKQQKQIYRPVIEEKKKISGKFECELCCEIIDAKESLASPLIECTKCKLKMCLQCFIQQISDKVQPQCVCLTVFTTKQILNLNEDFYKNLFKSILKRRLAQSLQYQIMEQSQYVEIEQFQSQVQQTITRTDNKYQQLRAALYSHNRLHNIQADEKNTLVGFKKYMKQNEMFKYLKKCIQKKKIALDKELMDKVIKIETKIDFLLNTKYERPFEESIKTDNSALSAMCRLFQDFVSDKSQKDQKERINQVQQGRVQDITVKIHNYLCKCKKDGCSGLIGRKFGNCNMCPQHYCIMCLAEINGEKEKKEHICISEDIALTNEIANNCKLCPQAGCNEVIFKVDGCDQMFCVVCKTAFQWSTGIIVKSGIHNPHYFQWRQQQRVELEQLQGVDDQRLCEIDDAQLNQILETIYQNIILGNKHQTLINRVKGYVQESVYDKLNIGDLNILRMIASTTRQFIEYRVSPPGMLNIIKNFVNKTITEKQFATLLWKQYRQHEFIQQLAIFQAEQALIVRNSIFLYMQGADSLIIQNLKSYLEDVNKQVFSLCLTYKYIFPFQNHQKATLDIQQPITQSKVQNQKQNKNIQ